MNNYLTKSLLGLAMATAFAAEAGQIDRFTATSASGGVLGYLEYDHSVFDGTSFQYVNNSNLLNIDFTEPVSLFHVTTAGPASEGTYFDSTGATPTVVGGSGFTGGNDFPNGVWIYGSNGVVLAGHDYSDVTWTTTISSQGVPEAGSIMAMLGSSLLVCGTLARRKSA